LKDLNNMKKIKYKFNKFINRNRNKIILIMNLIFIISIIINVITVEKIEYFFAIIALMYPVNKIIEK